MGAWRMRAIPVQQSALTCWAAAISSFGRLVRGVPDWSTVADVQAFFRAEFPGELNADGSLKTPSGWQAFATRFDLKIQEIRIRDPLTGSAGSASTGISSIIVDDLSAEHFIPKLSRSHVIVVSGTYAPGSLSHTVVAYGADRFRVCFMYPLQDPAATGPLRRRGGSGRSGKNWFCETYNDFFAAPRYLLIWRE